MSTNPYATRIEYVDVNGRQVATDQEGYIQNMDDWSEEYALALAKKESLELTQDHWDVIYFIREAYERNRVQAQVRDMIKHFKKAWGKERGNNHYLHDIFPKGGPQKQGNRMAGIRKTKGEH
ncbi:MAG: TusE/DsrC/DsvC family sulfur relay protein [Sedimenticola sp.]